MLSIWIGWFDDDRSWTKMIWYDFSVDCCHWVFEKIPVGEVYYWKKECWVDLARIIFILFRTLNKFIKHWKTLSGFQHIYCSNKLCRAPCVAFSGFPTSQRLEFSWIIVLSDFDFLNNTKWRAVFPWLSVALTSVVFCRICLKISSEKSDQQVM